VAVFPQSHSGDVSPNTAGPQCINTVIMRQVLVM